MIRVQKSVVSMVGAAVIVLGTASFTPVLAAITTFKFSGVVDYVDNPFDIFDESIKTGGLISGSYTFNSTSLDSSPSDPSVGSYISSGTPHGIKFSVGGYTFGGDDVEITVATGASPYGSSYGIIGDIELRDPFDQAHPFWISLYPAKTNAFSSDALPLTPPSLNLFTGGSIGFEYNYASGFAGFTGTLNSLTVTSVPEPSPVLGTLAFAAFGVAGYVFKKQKAGGHK